MTIQRIVRTDLGFRKVCARWVPHELTEEYKNRRMAAALDFLARYEAEGELMLSRIVTGDETWVHHYTLPTKRQSSIWKAADKAAPTKFKMGKSAHKVLCTTFWNAKGVIFVQYTKATVGAAQYFDTMMHLRSAIKNKRPGIFWRGIVLMHDNAPAHSAKTITSLLTSFMWNVFSNPLYFPDLAPSDYHISTF